MARSRAVTPPTPVRLRVRRSEASRLLMTQLQQAEQMRARTVATQTDLDQLKRDFWSWGEFNEQLLRQLFTDTSILDDYRMIAIGFGEPDDPRELLRTILGDIESAERRLASIAKQLDIIEEPRNEMAETNPEQRAYSRRVFVVHGRAAAPKLDVARFLEMLELEPLILHEQPGRGRTIIEKFEDYSDVQFAIVLLTPDDFGSPADAPDDRRPRARQNVIFELGYFIGKLGRMNVVALNAGQGDFEILTDYQGVSYVPYDQGGAWKIAIARELKAAGIPIDFNKLV